MSSEESSGKRRARRSVDVYDPSSSSGDADTSSASKRTKRAAAVYVVESIVDKRVVGTGTATRTEYRVRW
eukprot:COSAG01_NODE_11881_length_1842_cov_1.667814_2_plen_69_part_01